MGGQQGIMGLLGISMFFPAAAHKQCRQSTCPLVEVRRMGRARQARCAGRRQDLKHHPMQCYAGGPIVTHSNLITTHGSLPHKIQSHHHRLSPDCSHLMRWVAADRRHHRCPPHLAGPRGRHLQRIRGVPLVRNMFLRFRGDEMPAESYPGWAAHLNCCRS